MTITTADPRSPTYSGNGVTTDFDFDFSVLDANHLQVVQTVVSTGVETIKTITTHYTIAFNADRTGTVTMLTAPPSGETIDLILVPDMLQGVDLDNNGPYQPEVVEGALDKLTQQAQYILGLYNNAFLDPSADAAAAAASAAAAAASAASAAGTVGTSTTSLTIGLGSKVFTTQAGLQFGVGTYVIVVSDSAPTTKQMVGQVTAYSGTSLTVNVLLISGSTTHADWTIAISGAPQIGGQLPIGGAIDELLVKLSATDYDVGFQGPGKHTVDLLVAGMVEQSSDAPTGYTDERGVTNKVMVSGYSFPPGSDKSLQVKLPLPKGFDETVDLQFKPYWTTDDVAGTGNVEWDFQAQLLRDSDAQDSAWGTAVTVTDTFITDDDVHIGAESGNVTPGGTFAERCMLAIRVTRTGSSDTYTQDAVLEAVQMTMTYKKWNDD